MRRWSVQRRAVRDRAELDELELELDPPPPPFPPLFPLPPLDELELLDDELLDEPLDELEDPDELDDPDEELLVDEVLELELVVDELVLVVDEACCDVLLVDVWLELDETIGSDTLVGSVMPTHAVASAAGALTSSSRKLRRAVSTG